MTKKNLITALAFGLPLMVVMIAYNIIINGGLTLTTLVSITTGGLIGSILFAWAMLYATKKLFKKIVIETSTNENILKVGGANHFKGKEGVGGKLVLTDKRLIFKSHELNIQNHQDNFDLEQVKEVKATRTLGFLQNGLILELQNNNRHRFIVDDPTDWVEKIVSKKRLTN